MANRTRYIPDDLYDYMLSVSLREPPVFQALRDATSSLSSSNMQISPEQGQFMALLAQSIGAKKALEIGVYTGYSALCVASVLPDDGKLVALDINAEWTELAKTFWQKAGVESKMDLRIAPALETLDQLIANGESDSFDFVFIDADKENYEGYYEKSLQLIRSGGLILLDNVFLFGNVSDPSFDDPTTKAVRALNEKLSTDERVTISMLPISDGLTIARKL